MNCLRRKKFQSGFTAVELMIAMTIGLLISAVVVTVFSTSATTYRVANSVAAMQETGRVAIAAIERDSRMAGFRGCNSNNVNNTGPLINTILTPTAYNNALGTYVRGYQSLGGIWVPALEDVYPGISPTSDVLVMRIPNGPAVTLSATMANANVDVPLNSAAGLAVGDRMIVADCAQSSAFRITGFAGNNVQHAAGLNTTTDLQRAFGNDAIAVPYITRAYYVGASSSGIAGETSLWVKDGPNAPEELVENVQRFDVFFGEDLNNDYVADVFRTANNVVNFANVVAVQVHLQTRGGRDNEALTPTAYRYLGTNILPADRFLRRVYVATIQLRNRVL